MLDTSDNVPYNFFSMSFIRQVQKVETEQVNVGICATTQKEAMFLLTWLINKKSTNVQTLIWN